MLGTNPLIRRLGRGALVGLLTLGLVVLAPVPAAQADVIGHCPAGWSRVPTPARIIPQSEGFTDVVAISDNDVWAVGPRTGGLGQRGPTMTQHWNGISWARVPAPDPEDTDNSLDRVDASATNNVWAVGRIGNSTPLVARSDGNAWTQVAVPAQSSFLDIAVLSPTDVWAVGSQAGVRAMFHWDGASWSTVATPAPANGGFSRIDASTPDNVWAIGSYSDGYFNKPFVLRWDGATWSTVTLPAEVVGALGFYGISTTSASDVWLLGVDPPGPPQTNGPWSMHFDGVTWRRDRIGEAGSQLSISGIASLGGGSAWAVGGFGSATFGGTAATFHWSGSGWTQEPPPPLPASGDQSSTLSAVAVAPNRAVWAVGGSSLSTYAARRCDGPDGPLADQVVRLAGADRIATAVAVSSASPAGSAGAVVLTRSDGFADALAGTPLAVAEGGPILLTPSGAALDQRTLAEIRRVLPAGRKVYVLGGPAALSTQVDAALVGAGYPVTRLQGQDRYATAVSIAHLGLHDPPLQLLATGLAFPDALAGGAAASTGPMGGAVLLTRGNELTPETAAYLADHPATRYALGGPAAGVQGVGATPIVGADRYETAVLVAQTLFADPWAAVLATGANFPDALAGGALAGRNEVPLLLSPPDALPAVVDTYLARNRGAVRLGVVLGGLQALSSGVLDAFRRTLS